MLIRARRYGTQKGKQNDPCAFKIKHYQHRKSTSHKHIHETPKTIYKIKKKERRGKDWEERDPQPNKQ